MRLSSRTIDMPTIETARLTLRPIMMRDLESLQRLIYGDADATKYLPTGKPWPLGETQALVAWWVGQWQARKFGVWAVTETATGEFLGDCGLMYMPSTTHTIELMYSLRKSAWGKGYASEAAQAAVRHGFEQMGLEHIVALAVPENIGSRRVMEKIGMRFDGITAKYYGADLAAYSLTRKDFHPDVNVYNLKD